MNSQNLTCDFTLSGFSMKFSEKNWDHKRQFVFIEKLKFHLYCVCMYMRHGSMKNPVIEDEYAARKSDGMTAITLHNSQ